MATRGLSTESLTALVEEVHRARAKFPGNRFLLTALMEELGEVARGILQKDPQEDIRRELLQVACVAMRMYEEGDPVYDALTEAESLA